MPTDLSLPVRQSIVAHLRADTDLTGRISAARIYGEQSPADTLWPFIRLGFAATTPFEATEWDGSEHRITIHVFCKGPYTDRVLEASASVVRAMETLTVAGASIVDLQWLNTQVIRDQDEADAYHAIVDYSLTVT